MTYRVLLWSQRLDIGPCKPGEVCLYARMDHSGAKSVIVRIEFPYFTSPLKELLWRMFRYPKPGVFFRELHWPPRHSRRGQES